MGKITGVYRSSFPCKKKGCNRSFKSESERSKHNGLTHQNVTKYSLPTTGEILEVQRQEDGDFQCPICRSYESPDPSEIRKHCKSCDALPYGPISTANWNVGAAAAPAGSGAPTTGGGDGWLPSFSHKTLPGAKSVSTVSSAATMTTSSQGNRPTHATKSPHHSQPLLQGRPQQIVASASVPDYAVKAPSASVAPSRSFAGVSSHVNALAGPSRPPASPARAVSNRGGRASTSSESSRGMSHYGQRPNVAVSKTARKRTATTDARQIPIYRDSALSESDSRAGADRRRSDASDRTEASDSDGGIVVISSPSSATASPQKRKRSSGLRRTASSSPSLGGAILPPRVSQASFSTRSPQAQPTTLKRKSTSSLPTPSTGGPRPPTKRLRRSSSASALGTDDDLFGGSDDDDDGSSAAGQISLVTQLSDQARPTSLAKVVTESYPSPEPSGGEEDCGFHERAIVSGPALAPLESCRSVAPRSSPVTAGLRAPSAPAVSNTTTGQEHILGFLEEMLAKGAMDVAVESNTVEWTHAGTHYEPPVMDHASIPHIAAPAPAPALVLEPAPAQIVIDPPTSVAHEDGLDRSSLAGQQGVKAGPTVVSLRTVNSSTVATGIDAPHSPSPDGSVPRQKSPRGGSPPQRSMSAERLQPPSPVGPVTSAAVVEGRCASIPTGGGATLDGSQSEVPASSLSQAVEPQATPSGASNPPTQSTSGPEVATQETATPTRAPSPAGSPDRSQTSVHLNTSPSPMRSHREAERASALVIEEVPAEEQRQSPPVDESHAQPSGASTPSAASVLVQATPSPDRQKVFSSAQKPLSPPFRSGQRASLGPAASSAGSRRSARPDKKDLSSHGPSQSSSSQAGSGSSSKQDSSAESTRPVVIGTGLRRTPPPPAEVHSSQSNGTQPAQPRIRPRAIPLNQSPYFYYKTSIQSLLRFDDPPYGRLRKLAFRVELLLGWRPLLVDKYERILAGRSKVGVLNKDFAKAFQKTLSQLKEDALEDTVDLTRDWLIRTQLAVDPSSIYDASFTGLFRDYYPPGSVGRERVSAMAAVVFEFVLRWTGHVNDLPAGLRAADLTYVDPADPSERLLVNPVPWAVAKGLIDPPCQRVAVAWRLLKDLGWWDVDPSELDHETSQDGLVDDDAVPQTAE